MKKTKSGMSLVALLATIVIMIILTTTITISAVTVSNNAKRINFATELSYVQEMVYGYNLSNANTYPVRDSVIVDISQVTAKEITQFDGEKKDNNKIVLYQIDFNLLGKSELKYGNGSTADDIYAVSKETGKVYYIKSLKVGSRTYYTLTDDLKQAINYTDIVRNNDINKDGIVFIPSSTNWTNKNVDMQIKVPVEYTSVTLIAKQNGANVKTLSIVSTDSQYNIYNVNNVAGNYQVYVSYTKAGAAYTQEQSVNNYDKTVPTFTISSVVNVSTGDTSTNKYVKIENLKIGNSGLKVIKYDKLTISQDSIYTYFKSNGIEVNNNIIMLDTSAENITVYVEDNAGNYGYMNVVVK